MYICSNADSGTYFLKLFSMYSGKSYELTKKEYNYLLPVLRKKIFVKPTAESTKYYFIGGFEELRDMLGRLKGVYGYFNSHNSFIDYKCSLDGSLEPFREEMKKYKQH